MSPKLRLDMGQEATGTKHRTKLYLSTKPERLCVGWYVMFLSHNTHTRHTHTHTHTRAPLLRDHNWSLVNASSTPYGHRQQDNIMIDCGCIAYDVLLEKDIDLCLHFEWSSLEQIINRLSVTVFWMASFS